MALYNINDAKNNLNSRSGSLFGRQLNDNDFNEIGRRVNYQGGDVDDATMNNAYGALNSYGAEQGWKPLNSNDLQKSAQTFPTPTTFPQQRDHGGVGRVSDGSVPPANNQPPAPGGGATPQGLAGIIGPGGQLNPMQQAAQEAVLGLLANSNRAVTLQDPEIQPVSDAYRSRRQRGIERERQQLAEMAAANGTLGTGGFESDVLGSLQTGNRDVAMFDSNLVLNEMNTRRQMLIQGIQQAAQMGDAQAQQTLQRQLALLEATIQQQDIDLRKTLGSADIDIRNRGLGLQGDLGRGDLATRLLGMLMQDEQYYSGLGLNAAQLQALLNQNAVLGLLNGGGF